MTAKRSDEPGGRHLTDYEGKHQKKVIIRSDDLLGSNEKVKKKKKLQIN